jgi:hypothetical protein
LHNHIRVATLILVIISIEWRETRDIEMTSCLRSEYMTNRGVFLSAVLCGLAYSDWSFDESAVVITANRVRKSMGLRSSNRQIRCSVNSLNSLKWVVYFFLKMNLLSFLVYIKQHQYYCNLKLCNSGMLRLFEVQNCKFFWRQIVAINTMEYIFMNCKICLEEVEDNKINIYSCIFFFWKKYSRFQSC